MNSNNKNHKLNNYNGKIESPKIIVDGKTVLDCDFSNNTSSSFSKSIIGPDFFFKNFPTRAVTSSQWDGSEMNWQHKPEHYAAVHFHDDDIYDFEWDTDFKFKIPKDNFLEIPFPTTAVFKNSLSNQFPKFKTESMLVIEV